MKIFKEGENHTEKEDADVEIDYRCYMDEVNSIAPMTLWDTLHESNDLNTIVARGKESYLRDYVKVEVMEIRVDIKSA